MRGKNHHVLLDQPGLHQQIHRRTHVKADGRSLYLYGYDKHEGTPFPEVAEVLAKGGHLRHHPLRDEWNIYASHRQNRPFMPSSAEDPLAPTRSQDSPTEIPFTNFELAVFENKFTNLHENAPLPEASSEARTRRAKGRCEVVVYSPDLEGSIHSIGQDKRRLLVAAWIDRYQQLSEIGCDFVLPFENRGDEVGATLHHPHGQIYGFDYVPAVQSKAVEAFRSGYDLSAQVPSFIPAYSVAQAGGLVAFCPPFARFPYEIWIASKTPRAGPWVYNAEERDAYAHLIGDVCRRYDAFFEQPTPYMMSLHAAPRGEEATFQFTTQFYPLLRAKGRLKYLASVEQSTSVFTIDVLPETASQLLRSL